MALDFNTIKKIEAGSTNVGMIQNSAGDILWRKAYKECSLGFRAVDASGAVQPWKPYFSTTFNGFGNNAYFHYGDSIGVFRSLDGKQNMVVSWYDGDISHPQRYASVLSTATVRHRFTPSSTVVDSFRRDIFAPGLVKNYGKIQRQTSYSNYGGYATDDKACIDTGETQDNAWTNVLAKLGVEGTVDNRYYSFGEATSSPLAEEWFGVSLARNGSGVTVFARCAKIPAVTFSYKLTSGGKGTITLMNGKSATIAAAQTDTIKFYQQSCYIDSSGSVVGSDTAPFLSVTISSLSKGPRNIPLTAVFPLTNSTKYGFKQDSDGNITNTNQKVAKSFCYGTLKFRRPAARFTKLRITYTQSSERNYDFGQFSKIDTMLCAYPVADKNSTGFGANLQHSCKGEDNTEHVVVYDISSLSTTDDHIINFKYHKDFSGDVGTDTFTISKIEFLDGTSYNLHYDTAENYYTLTVNNDNSVDVSFEWVCVYIEGSEQDYTEPDEKAAVIPAHGSYDFWMHVDPIPEQSGRIFCIFKCNGQYYTIYQ